jgi:KUP system potassium uptake protein
MLVWFLMLAVMGSANLVHNPGVLTSLSPVWAIRFLAAYPGGFILLGAVFLCTTGAEALYSDLGHVGLKNIRISWLFVKISLLLNYFGQCAWLLQGGMQGERMNPFYGIMPEWFLLPGIFIATAAAIIASQALITGSYTLISEAIKLNFWPKQNILNPTQLKGQVYVPFINWFLMIACSAVVIFFRESSKMEAAYGLSITITMIMTTLLLSFHLYQKKVNRLLIVVLLVTYLVIEGSFLVANLHKFRYGGWFTLLLASMFFIVMYGWYFGRKLKNRYVTFMNIADYIEPLKDLSSDMTVPVTATNLVYVIKANNPEQVESKVLYSIFHKQPKRASTYWFVHIDRRDDPYTFEYKVTHIVPGILIRIDFYLGFRVEPQINLYFREVIDDLKKSGEIKMESSYETIRKRSMAPDFLFILIDRVMSGDAKLPWKEKFILSLHRISRFFCISDVSAFNLDSSITVEEKVPIIVGDQGQPKIRRLVGGTETSRIRTAPLKASS